MIRISLKFVPKCAIDKESALVQVMAWRHTGDKPLPDPMLTQFTDAYMRHYGELSHKYPSMVAVQASRNILMLDFIIWLSISIVIH